MTLADTIFKENIKKIMEQGVFLKMPVRATRMEMWPIPNISLALLRNDLSRENSNHDSAPYCHQSAIKEVLWIYQDQSNSLELLNDKYNVHY